MVLHCINIPPFTHSVVNGHVGCCQYWPVTILLPVFEHTYAILVDINLGMILQDKGYD